MLCLVIDFKMRKFSGFFYLFEEPRKRTNERFISGFPKSVVLYSQKFCGLLEMIKNPFWYKKYKYINWLKASINCSMWVVYWRLLNRFSGGLLNNLLLGLHHRCLLENFRKIFQNNGRLLLTFNIYKVLISKKGKLL